ncbi:Putative permease [Candidatus Nitrosarchaeum limnium SFB1]|uniref:Probable membrane transporter protein n=1 Tax=Candidatus Nitrosarchaeum limnium SFB1 TaxID=886738 RepID=F3KKD1_9ARCH|nr:Putative permease [Candidatus Nitrosarchaeum limnium SFB1]
MTPIEIFLEPVTLFLSIISGVVVGFSLGLVGGGGSVLAVPLLLYVVGVKDTHVAIGTSALAIGIIAVFNIFYRRKTSTLHIKKGLTFALPGIGGTLLGSQLGLWTPPENLLILFAVFMVVIGIIMIKYKITHIEITSEKHGLISLKKNLPLSGFSVGILSGYFGIGGGFLIVPTMMYSGGLNILQAIGTSLVSVSSFGLVTAGRYFVAGNVDLVIALLFIIGGILGGYFGIKTSKKITQEKITKFFSILLFVVASYIIINTISG